MGTDLIEEKGESRYKIKDIIGRSCIATYSIEIKKHTS